MKLADLEDRMGLHDEVARQLEIAGLDEIASSQAFSGESATIYVATAAGLWVATAKLDYMSVPAMTGELTPWADVNAARLVTTNGDDVPMLTLRIGNPAVEIMSSNALRPAHKALVELAKAIWSQYRPRS